MTNLSFQTLSIQMDQMRLSSMVRVISKPIGAHALQFMLNLK